MDMYTRDQASADATHFEQLGIESRALRSLLEQVVRDDHVELCGDHDWEKCQDCGGSNAVAGVVRQGLVECLLFLLEGWPLEEAQEVVADIVALVAGVEDAQE